jgi:ubiquinol-cytochrome c reductase cytochrome c subunit
VSRRVVLAVLAAAAVLGPAPVATAAPPPSIVRPEHEGNLSDQELGRQLFAGNCSTCHGSKGEGVSNQAPQRGSTAPEGVGPSVVGVGRLATDFYLRTGYMPLAQPYTQPERNRVSFSDREIVAIEKYVDSLSTVPGPPVPRPDPGAGSVSRGLELFTEHCAGCHQVVAEGGVVTGARVPPLDQATTTQIAQAVRIGPYVMPKFSKRDISDADLNSIIAYVNYAKDPDDRGGWGINHLGPFPEGLVTWGLAAILLVLMCVFIGERLKRA